MSSPNIKNAAKKIENGWAICCFEELFNPCHLTMSCRLEDYKNFSELYLILSLIQVVEEIIEVHLVSFYCSQF